MTKKERRLRERIAEHGMCAEAAEEYHRDGAAAYSDYLNMSRAALELLDLKRDEMEEARALVLRARIGRLRVRDEAEQERLLSAADFAA